MKKDRTASQRIQMRRAEQKQQKAAEREAKSAAGNEAKQRKTAEGKAKRQGKETKKAEKSVRIFNIRNKIVVCFLVPIVFMIFIGTSAYQKASRGMSDNFVESTSQTLAMSVEYLDMVGSFITAETKTYAFDASTSKYLLGMYDDDRTEMYNYLTTIQDNMASKKMLNPYINNVHIIAKKGISILTSSTKDSTDREGFMAEYVAEMVPENERLISSWVDTHDLLDTKLTLKKEDYILAYHSLNENKQAVVVIDLKASAVQEFIDQVDLGDGSIVGFITYGGRELIHENLPEIMDEKGKMKPDESASILTEGESVFYGQDFYTKAFESEETAGVSQVEYKNDSYYFLYNKGNSIDCVMCALVPVSLVTQQADSIKTLTFCLTLLACVIVLGVGLAITSGIKKNMDRLSGKLGEVSEGDLTVEVTAKGRDEFQTLAASANHMVHNTKKLVQKVSGATAELEQSSGDVEEISGVIDSFSKEITQAIGEINDGMGRESEHAQECVEKTDRLSEEIRGVITVVEKVEDLVSETEAMINQGMEIVKLLGERAQSTTKMTAQVSESIQTLRTESEIINSFVTTITGISQQTNLLSLNASIEAARAGEAGRGFAVVAEEIRKLADDSAKAAGEIRNNVEHIAEQTMNSVDSANEAQGMVELQTEAVTQVVEVFEQMQKRMAELVAGLKEIVISTERADRERSAAVDAVKNISEIIEDTAGSTETVAGVAQQLLERVESLNHTAETLSANMEELKTEIAVFKL